MSHSNDKDLEVTESSGPEVVFYTEQPTKEEVIQSHDLVDEVSEEDIEEPLADSIEIALEEGLEDGSEVSEDAFEPLESIMKEVSEDPADEGSEDVIVFLGDLPGAPANTPDPKEFVEVEEKKSEDSSKKDSNSAEDSFWAWDNSNTDKFVGWVKDKFSKVPKHSGYDTSGIERAISFLEKLDAEISKAMRTDLEENLDANCVEEIRKEIEDGIERLYERLEKIVSTKKARKRNKKAETITPELKKYANSRTYDLKGMYITVPLLIARIARICINAHVSAGHDLAEVYKDQVEKYKLTDREQAEVQQLLMDMGFGLPAIDRGYAPGETFDYSEGKYDLASQYNA